jgi:hypothetical protein
MVFYNAILTTDFQHAYREGQSTWAVLTQMTDDWLREIDKKDWELFC